jgi:hypothetical protein
MPRSFTAATGALLLVAGIVILAAAFPRPAALAPLAVATASPTPTPAGTVAPAATPADPTPIPTIGPIPEGYRVVIPRLAIDLPIAEGDIERDVVVQQTPENYAFHFPGTAIPGTIGNSYIYAHARRGMFLSLWNARTGDEIHIRTPGGGDLKFVVTEVHPRVPPADTSWIQPSTDVRLTLQTSTGPSRDDPRFVVVAAPA